MVTGSVFSTVQKVARGAARRLSHHLHGRQSSGFRWPLQAAIEAERHVIATSDAGAISYYEDTTGEGRPLVLLHGIHAAGSAFEMRTLFYEFRGERPVYALDLPGFGFSQRGGMPYTPKTYVHAIEHLLRHIAVESPDGRADIVALSLTSEYAAKVASDLPELVHSLVLISPSGFERIAQGDRQRSEMPELLKSAARVGGELFFDALVAKPSLTHYLRKSFAGNVDRGLLEYSHSTSHQPGAQYAPLAFVSGELFPPGDPKQAYGRVKAPVMVLYDEDPYVTFGGLRAFILRTPNYEAERIAHTRGLPHIEARDRTMRVIRTYWEKLEADEAGERRESNSGFIELR